MDSVPGALCKLTIPNTIDPQDARLFGSTIWRKPKPEGEEITIFGMGKPGIVHEDGLLLCGTDNIFVNVKRLVILISSNYLSDLLK